MCYPPENARVAVALSGGVDSSVAAALLRNHGFDVVCVTLQLVDCQDATGVKVCCGAEAIAAARRLSRALNVPHEVIDCRHLFQSSILEPAWNEYRRGRTPSPCIHCNRLVKFGFLLDAARDLGASYVATGHHARVDHAAPDGPVLRCGHDANKDQTYFLFALDRERLAQVLFPVGTMTKEEVRQVARDHALPTAERIESTDACFVREELSFAATLEDSFGPRLPSGSFVDDEGRTIGRHDGIHRFTIGQRRGLGVDTGKRLWVRRIDAGTGRVTLTGDESTLFSRGLSASDPVWTGRDESFVPPARFRADVKIRYRHTPTPATVEYDGTNTVTVCFDEPQRAVTPGQAVVFYDDDRVIGGAWIDDLRQ